MIKDGFVRSYTFRHNNFAQLMHIFDLEILWWIIVDNHGVAYIFLYSGENKIADNIKGSWG